MKRLFFSIIAAALCVGIANAQDTAAAVDSQQQTTTTDSKAIWGKGRFTRIGYAFAQTAGKGNPIEQGQYSFFATKGTSFRFPSKAIGGVLKFGIEVSWLDFQFSKYNDATSNLTWTSEINKDQSLWDSFYEDVEEELNLGCMAISAGVGVGPNVSVAPFANKSGSILQPLRASVYFQYSPTFQAYIKSQNDDDELSTAFCHMMNFGGAITYKSFSIGVEARWGSGKFKPLEFDDEDEDIESLGSSKYTRKFANTRIYIQLAI